VLTCLIPHLPSSKLTPHTHTHTYTGCYEICSILLTRGAALHVQDWESGWTPLHAAFYFKHWQVALLLLKAGAFLGDQGDHQDHQDRPERQQHHHRHHRHHQQHQHHQQQQQQQAKYTYNLFEWPRRWKAVSGSHGGSSAGAGAGGNSERAYVDNDGLTPFALLTVRLADTATRANTDTGIALPSNTTTNGTHSRGGNSATPTTQRQSINHHKSRRRHSNSQASSASASASVTGVHAFGKADFMLGFALPNRYVSVICDILLDIVPVLAILVRIRHNAPH